MLKGRIALIKWENVGNLAIKKKLNDNDNIHTII